MDEVPRPKRRDAPPRWRTSTSGGIRRHLGAAPSGQVTPAHRVVAPPRGPLHGRRSIRPAGAAALSRRGGCRTIPGLRRRGVPGLARVPDAARQRGRAQWLAGSLRAGRTAVPDCFGSRRGRRAAELARSARAATLRGRQRVEPSHDAWRDTRCRCSLVRPSDRSLRGAPLEAGIPERSLRSRRGP